MRSNDRKNNELRPIKITRRYTKYAEGSVLVEFGQTQVICTASLITGVPRFLKNQGKGWLTAEYGMLPRATSERTDREAVKGKQSGRSQEIQRLIGRALRSTVHLTELGENTLAIDCDVIQADGGTRTASITGSAVAVADAIRHAYTQGMIKTNPLKNLVAAVSIGICKGEILLDLDYKEDSAAETDMNIVMNDEGKLIEIQGTAEAKDFSVSQLHEMVEVAEAGIKQIIAIQKEALDLPSK